jgi:hypothetical protein
MFNIIIYLFIILKSIKSIFYYILILFNYILQVFFVQIGNVFLVPKKHFFPHVFKINK